MSRSSLPLLVMFGVMEYCSMKYSRIVSNLTLIWMMW